MLEPIQKSHWPIGERRIWSLAISVLMATIFFTLFSFSIGKSWTYKTIIKTEPSELSLKVYEIDSDLVEFSLGLPVYPVSSSYFLSEVIPPAWIYPIFLSLFFFSFIIVSTGVTYLKDTFFYGGLTAIAIGVIAFGNEPFSISGIDKQWISAFSVLLACLPVYFINQWRDSWGLGRRFIMLFLWYSSLLGVTLFLFGSISDPPMVSASLWYPLLWGSILFIILNSTDVLQGVLILVTREENSRQSWLHFTIFSGLYLSNFLLVYLKNTGQLVLDIFYPHPFFLQFFTLIVGFWLLDPKGEIVNEQSNRQSGISILYVGLAIILTSTVGLAYGLANDLMVEVLEDAICLIHFSMGVVFLLYVVINYFQLMALGLKVHLVMFKPRYMPLSAIPVFGLSGVWIFLLNQSYYPYYQSLAAKDVLYADYYQQKGDLFLAENYLKNALGFDSRNQRANLSLAGLYTNAGNLSLGQEFARNSMNKKAVPEAIIAVAQAHRVRNELLQEILEYQEGLRLFPENGHLQNNLGIAFHASKFKDSSVYYFSKAAGQSATKEVGKSNLGFYYLMNRLEAEGLPQKSPDTDFSDNWAQINNNLVFANAAREKSPSNELIVKSFQQVPNDLKPYLLYHLLLNKAITRDTVNRFKILALPDDSLKKYYSEPIEMARAFWNYRTGEVANGLEKMVQLHQISGTNRLDFTLLVGQMYFELKAYSTASHYFKMAAQMGMNSAYYWYAISCLEAGKGAEASIAFSHALPYLGPNDRIRVSVLIDGLKSGQFHNAAQRSDPEKSAYLKTQWKTLTDQQILDLIYLTSDKEAQRLLWSYAFHRAYNENSKNRCNAFIQFGNQLFAKKEKWKRMLEGCQPYLADITDDAARLKTWLNNSKPDFGSYGFFEARLLHLQGKTEEAAKAYLTSMAAHPLSGRQAGLAIGFLSGLKNHRSEAYDWALKISDLDPFNPEFLKLYAILAVKEGLADFAYQLIPKIEVLSTKVEALAFKNKIDEMVKAKYQALSNQSFN